MENSVRMFCLDDRPLFLKVLYAIVFCLVVAYPLYFLGRSVAVGFIVLSALLLLVFFPSVFVVVCKDKISPDPLGRLMFGLYAVLLAISLASFSPDVSVFVIITLILLQLYAAVMVVLLSGNIKVLEWGMWFATILLCASIVGECIVFVMRFLPSLYVHLPNHFRDPFYMRDGSSCYGITIPFLWAFLWEGGRLRKVLFIAYTICVLVLLHVTHSRSGLTGVFVSSFMLVMLRHAYLKRHFWVRYGIVVLSFGFLLACMSIIFLFLPSLPLDFSKALIIPVDGPRQIIWAYTIHLISLKPWFGYGVYAARFLNSSKEIVPLYDLPYFNAHPHNFILQWLLDFGFIGFSCFIILFLGVFYFLCRYGRFDRYNIAVIASLMGFFTSSLSNYSFWSVWWQAVIVIYVILGVSKVFVSQKEK